MDFNACYGTSYGANHVVIDDQYIKMIDVFEWRAGKKMFKSLYWVIE
jgi:hypothetical protein